MTVDAFVYCPGGTGKKIKHCLCRDISGELEKIMRAMEGNQRVAALDRINRVLATRANRPCLLALKTLTLMDMQDMQSLEETVTTFVKAAPDNPLAHAFAALLEVRKNNLKAAVESLQAAIYRAKEIFPGELYDAIGAVAQALAADQQYVAARGHLLFRAMIGGQNEDAIQPLISISSAGNIPTLLKRDIIFEACQEDVPYRNAFYEASKECARGAWKSGLRLFEQLKQQVPGQPEVLQNVAAARSYLGDAGAAEAWHDYAMVESLDFHDAVIAEATAQLLDYEAARKTVGLVKLTLQVTDVSALQERMLSSELVLSSPMDPAEMRSDDTPPPKSVFQLLDRPLPKSDGEPTLDTVPRIVCQLFLFGKETDRAARLEMGVTKGAQCDQVRGMLAEMAGDLLLPDGEREEVLDAVPRDVAELFPTLRFPSDTAYDVRKRLANEAVQRQFSEKWPALPQSALDDKAPLEASGDPAYRVRLAALLLVLEQIVEVESWPVDVDQLRAQLGVAAVPPIDPKGPDLSALEPQDWARVEPERLTDDQLLNLYRQATIYSARRALRRLGQEVLRRGGLGEQLDLADVCGAMAQLAVDPDEALTYLRRAREHSGKAGKSPAQWYLAELPLRLMRGEGSEVRHILTVLQTRHIREPGVSESLFSILVRFGVVTPDGRLVAEPESVAAEAAADPGTKLWTPDSTQPASGEKKDSQLWVPGMD